MVELISTKKQTKLTDLQLSLVRMFGQNISENQTLEIRKILVDYFDSKLKDELNRVCEEKNYTEKDFVEMLNSKS